MKQSFKMRPTRYILALVMWLMIHASGIRTAFADDDLKTLSNKELLKEFEERGMKLKGLRALSLMPIHRPGFMATPEGHAYRVCKSEVTRRGKAIEQELLAMLSREARTDRGPDSQYADIRLTLAGELMEIVKSFHTEATATTLLKILEDDLLDVKEWTEDTNRLRKRIDAAMQQQDQAEVPRLKEIETKIAAQGVIKHNAIATLEHVTYITFRTGGDSSLGLRAVGDEQPEMNWWDVPEAARRYRQFLIDHGQHEERWLEMAIERAHKKLNDPHPDVCYHAAEFLQVDLRDTMPTETCRVLADSISKLDVTEKDPQIKGRFYHWNRSGVETSLNGLQWCCLLSEFRGYAQPHLKIVIEMPKRVGFDAPYVTFAVGRIGGTEALEELARVLVEAPKHEAEARAYLAEADHDNSDARGFWLQDQRFAREGFDRLAGRIFSNEEERLEWFANHHKESPRQWLESNLLTFASQIDAGNRGSPLTSYPDLLEQFTNLGEVGFPAKERTFTAVPWVEEHSEQLLYDEIRHTLALPKNK